MRGMTGTSFAVMTLFRKGTRLCNLWDVISIINSTGTDGPKSYSDKLVKMVVKGEVTNKISQK